MKEFLAVSILRKSRRYFATTPKPPLPAADEWVQAQSFRRGGVVGKAAALNWNRGWKRIRVGVGREIANWGEITNWAEVY